MALMVAICSQIVRFSNRVNKHMLSTSANEHLKAKVTCEGQVCALFTAAPSLIFNENESEAVRDRLASLQWAVLCFNAFSD